MPERSLRIRQRNITPAFSDSDHGGCQWKGRLFVIWMLAHPHPKHGKPQSFLFRLPSHSERARPSFSPVTTTVDFFFRPEQAVTVVKQLTGHMWYDPRRFDILSTIPSINHPLFASFLFTRSISVGCSPLELCKANVSVQRLRIFSFVEKIR